MNAEQASKHCGGSRPDVKAGKAAALREASDARTVGFRRGIWRVSTAAIEAGVRPHEISFKGTLQTLNKFLPQLSRSVSLNAWYQSLLAAIATHVVANRPDRYEPRLRKRRPKPYKHLREPRANYKRTYGASS